MNSATATPVSATDTKSGTGIVDSTRHVLWLSVAVVLGDGYGLDIPPLLRYVHRVAPPVVLYSATEASREIAALVQAALVKSRDPVDELLASVRELAAPKSG
jgi:hypothetical protein